MREDTVMKQEQQGLSVPNPDIVKPSKPFILGKHNNRINLKKFERVKYFTKALLELSGWGFSEQDVSSCANIIAAVENLIVWHKALLTYREGYKVYTEFKTVHPHMVGKQEIFYFGVKIGVTNGVAKVKQIKILKKIQTKKCQNTVLHTST